MELIVRVLACLAEGLGIRATARVFEVDPNTVLHWLVEAAEQLKAFSASFLCNVHVNQLQLDELYAVLRGVINGEISEDDAIKRLERSRHWVWTVIDPESKRLLATASGPRTLAMAQRVVHQVTQALAPGCVPLCLTDGCKEYRTAILAHCGDWIQPERRQDKGPLPKPRWMPLPALRYAQVVKSYRRRRLVGVTHRVVFGPRLAIEQVLGPRSWDWPLGLNEPRATAEHQRRERWHSGGDLAILRHDNNQARHCTGGRCGHGHPPPSTTPGASPKPG